MRRQPCKLYHVLFGQEAGQPTGWYQESSFCAIFIAITARLPVSFPWPHALSSPPMPFCNSGWGQGGYRLCKRRRYPFTHLTRGSKQRLSLGRSMGKCEPNCNPLPGRLVLGGWWIDLTRTRILWIPSGHHCSWAEMACPSSHSMSDSAVRICSLPGLIWKYDLGNTARSPAVWIFLHMHV
ncbi:hypothetical protein BJY00DRAFT_192695 [Aspergillus carlsbadensis]|nr:hypothetical protein BJY00DRAFT_192695 [Aspergillus carlsbadensis]